MIVLGVVAALGGTAVSIAQSSEAPVATETERKKATVLEQKQISSQIGDRKVEKKSEKKIPIDEMRFATELPEFPYKVEDLPDNERIFRGKAWHSPEGSSQRWAYDLGAARLEHDGTWRDKIRAFDTPDREPRNSDYYIWDKPVYAVTDGVIINCWRNAPDNLRPYWPGVDPSGDGISLEDQTWLHPQTRDGLVFGSGNFIVVEHQDGTRMAYAHGRKGTVPERLCPHDNIFLDPARADADSEVPASERVSVERGDFLFRTGNSGTSGAPHLHIEYVRKKPDGNSLPLRFRYGLAQPLDRTTMMSTTSRWQSFAGETIPEGPVVIWPLPVIPR